jgi:hypothetical protein
VLFLAASGVGDALGCVASSLVLGAPFSWGAPPRFHLPWLG